MSGSLEKKEKKEKITRLGVLYICDGLRYGAYGTFLLWHIMKRHNVWHFMICQGPQVAAALHKLPSSLNPKP